jgi:hypothetical protein
MPLQHVLHLPCDAALLNIARLSALFILQRIKNLPQWHATFKRQRQSLIQYFHFFWGCKRIN